jgi:hypothetical protein
MGTLSGSAGLADVGLEGVELGRMGGEDLPEGPAVA